MGRSLREETIYCIGWFLTLCLYEIFRQGKFHDKNREEKALKWGGRGMGVEEERKDQGGGRTEKDILCRKSGPSKLSGLYKPVWF